MFAAVLPTWQMPPPAAATSAVHRSLGNLGDRAGTRVQGCYSAAGVSAPKTQFRADGQHGHKGGLLMSSSQGISLRGLRKNLCRLQ